LGHFDASAIGTNGFVGIGIGVEAGGSTGFGGGGSGRRGVVLTTYCLRHSVKKFVVAGAVEFRASAAAQSVMTFAAAGSVETRAPMLTLPRMG
jgi:hypothetical protein